MFFFLSELYIVEASEAKSGNKVEVPNYEGKGGIMNLKLAKWYVKWRSIHIILGETLWKGNPEPQDIR